MSSFSDDTFDPTCSPTDSPARDRVPQEDAHAERAARCAPRDWSQLGRRVLAEAWCRTTEELANRRRDTARPVVPAPSPESQP